MKKLILLPLLLIPIVAQAGDMTVATRQMNPMTGGDIYSTGGWAGVQLSYQPADSNVYFFGSTESVSVYPMGKTHSYALDGLGLGIKRKWSDGIKLFAQIGVFKITDDVGVRNRAPSEGAYYYFNHRYALFLPPGVKTQGFDAFGVEHDPYVFAVEVGAEFTHQLTDNIDIGLSVSYRGLKIRETLRVYVDAWKYDETGACWEVGQARDFSTINTAINFTYHF